MSDRHKVIIASEHCYDSNDISGGGAAAMMPVAPKIAVPKQVSPERVARLIHAAVEVYLMKMSTIVEIKLTITIVECTVSLKK